MNFLLPLLAVLAFFFVARALWGARPQIKPGAATSSLYISAASNVGIGTSSPSAKLDVNGNAHINGNLQVEGNVVEYSDVNAKENFTAIDRADLLNRLMEIPIIGSHQGAMNSPLMLTGSSGMGMPQLPSPRY